MIRRNIYKDAKPHFYACLRAFGDRYRLWAHNVYACGHAVAIGGFGGLAGRHACTPITQSGGALGMKAGSLAWAARLSALA